MATDTWWSDLFFLGRLQTLFLVMLPVSLSLSIRAYFRVQFTTNWTVQHRYRTKNWHETVTFFRWTKFVASIQLKTIGIFSIFDKSQSHSRFFSPFDIIVSKLVRIAKCFEKPIKRNHHYKWLLNMHINAHAKHTLSVHRHAFRWIRISYWTTQKKKKKEPATLKRKITHFNLSRRCSLF